MSIGYACLAIGIVNVNFRSCLLKNASENNLVELIDHNLKSLENIIDYNINNDIRLFRVSSDIIPFGSHASNSLLWRSIFREQLNTIGSKIKKNGIRISMHPGQYTVLNSMDNNVVKRAVEDLHYHASVLDSLGVDQTNKIILHVGGIYGDKRAAMDRFAQRYMDLDDSIKCRLVIENDDKAYHVGDALDLGAKLKIPVVYDNLHNQVNPCDMTKDDYYWIDACTDTWSLEDGKQKIHYSQQDKMKKAGAHSESISINEFMRFYNGFGDRIPDIMLEVKDKNLSAVKCINCTSARGNPKALEQEWSRYKYLVLEFSPKNYGEIRALLKDKSSYPAIRFYDYIENSLAQKPAPGNTINTALHIWGYFKNFATDKEKDMFFERLRTFECNDSQASQLRRILWKLAERYHEKYLLSSYYFLQ